MPDALNAVARYGPALVFALGAALTVAGILLWNSLIITSGSVASGSYVDIHPGLALVVYGLILLVVGFALSRYASYRSARPTARDIPRILR